ncbi:MAG: polysaccharide deacetylase family protein [Fibrobacteres bacterium]|nr:polysaccharide deacetylase family protein [Fibrobacterota bacterium]
MLYILAVFTSVPVIIYAVWRKYYAKSYKTASPAIVYHSVDTESGLVPTQVPLTEFKKQIKWLSDNKFHTISPDDFLRQELEKQNNPGKYSRNLFIGFEDSYVSVAVHALPILKSAGFTSTLFVISDYIGRKNNWDVRITKDFHMTEDDIRSAIKDGFTIGSHTRTHRNLRSLNDIELRDELEGSRHALEDRFGVPVHALSYPFGRYDKRIQISAKDSGYKMAFTINRPGSQKEFDPYAIPVTGIYSIDKTHNFSSKLTRTGMYWMDIMRDKMFNRFACGTILVKSRKRKTTG